MVDRNAAALELTTVFHTPEVDDPPEDRSALDSWHWLSAALDELDYGILLVEADSRVAYCNYVASLELDREHPLQFVSGRLCARRAADSAAMQTALRHAATGGLRKLLILGEGHRSLCVSFVPLAPPSGTGQAAALIVFGKRKVSGELSIHGFAAGHGLTAAETRVLVALSNGEEPGRIAARLEVALSTVRTQLGSIRAKTGAASLRALLQQVASLPPLMGALRYGWNGAAAASGPRSIVAEPEGR